MGTPEPAGAETKECRPEVRIRIGGEAGMGIKAAGQTLSRTFASAGLHTFDVTEYPSLIRGGHNNYQLRVAMEPIFSHVLDIDILVALNSETIDIHGDAVIDDGAVLFDPKAVDWEASPHRDRLRGIGVPWEDIALEVSGNKIMANTVSLGAVLALAGFPVDYLSESLRVQFRAKAPEIAEKNVAAATSGYEYASKNLPTFPFCIVPQPDEPKRIIIDGNEAVGFGALAAGIGFYAAYPMTPASPLLHFFAGRDHEAGMVVKHTEDEIAAMNMVIGAVFGGTRAMCASAGGGFALMVEAFGFAGVSESPVVVGVFSRTAPGTGLPTWTEQADLRYVLHAAPSEFPRVILSPGDRAQAFELTWKAFNLADQLQTPVVILSDQYLQESRASMEPFDTSEVVIDRGKLVKEGDISQHPDALGTEGRYLRYKHSQDGVSVRALPGVLGANQIVNSYEHDEYGNAEESAEERAAQHEKRIRKMELARSLVPPPLRYGPDDADVSVVCFGSTIGPLREAMRWLDADGITVNALQVVTLSPFPADDVAAFIRRSKRPVVIEGNIGGQLEGLIRETTLLEVSDRLHRYDGRPFNPEQVSEWVRGLLGRDGAGKDRPSSRKEVAGRE